MSTQLSLSDLAKHRSVYFWFLLTVIVPVVFIGFWIPYLRLVRHSEQWLDVLQQGDFLLFSGLLLFTAGFEAMSISKLLTAYRRDNKLDQGGATLIAFGSLVLVLHALNVSDVRLSDSLTVVATVAPAQRTLTPTGVQASQANVTSPKALPSVSVNVYMFAATAITVFSILASTSSFLVANKRLRQ
jgi:hypothetical protein